MNRKNHINTLLELIRVKSKEVDYFRRFAYYVDLYSAVSGRAKRTVQEYLKALIMLEKVKAHEGSWYNNPRIEYVEI